jgi:hypothetical protein
MKFDPPILTRGPLSGRVYVVTHGKVLDKGQIEATRKYDVTEQFDALARATELPELLTNRRKR